MRRVDAVVRGWVVPVAFVDDRRIDRRLKGDAYTGDASTGDRADRVLDEMVQVVFLPAAIPPGALIPLRRLAGLHDLRGEERLFGGDFGEERIQASD